MLRFGLKLKKVLAGAVALASLYVVLEPGGVLLRLGCLVMATAAFGLWWEAKQSLIFAALESASGLAETIEPKMAVVPSPSPPTQEWVKMPVRYPRPVYIHHVTNFHLHTY